MEAGVLLHPVSFCYINNLAVELFAFEPSIGTDMNIILGNRLEN